MGVRPPCKVVSIRPGSSPVYTKPDGRRICIDNSLDGAVRVELLDTQSRAANQGERAGSGTRAGVTFGPFRAAQFFADGMMIAPRRQERRTLGGVQLLADVAWAVGRCIQHHSDTSWTGVYLDIALPDAGIRVLEAADDQRVASPNVLVIRRRSGHAAIGWFLQEPVH